MTTRRKSARFSKPPTLPEIHSVLFPGPSGLGTGSVIVPESPNFENKKVVHEGI